MRDKEIMDKYTDLDKSFLMEKENREVMDMLYKYKEAFSLRDEIGICPNIEVKIDVTDRSYSLLGFVTSKRKIKLPFIKK